MTDAADEHETTKIVLTISDNEQILSVEQARSLKMALSDLFAADVDKFEMTGPPVFPQLPWNDPATVTYSVRFDDASEYPSVSIE